MLLIGDLALPVAKFYILISLQNDVKILNDYAHQLHNDWRILLSPLTDNSNNQSWWITICTLILLFILKSVLWLLENAPVYVHPSFFKFSTLCFKTLQSGPQSYFLTALTSLLHNDIARMNVHSSIGNLN